LRKLLRILLLFLVVALIAEAVPISINAGNTVSFYPPYPVGNIGVSKPEIGWTVFLNGETVQSAEMYLNGQSLKVEYAADRATFYANPTKILSGTNNVSIKIKLKNWANVLEKTWTFTVDKQSVNSLPLPSEQQMTALNLANDYRFVLGMPLYQFNQSLNMAAKKHADYQANLNTFSHYQTPNTSGFFGQAVGDRSNYYGFFGSVAEDLSYQSNPSIQEAVDSLFDAPYHRIPFLIPSYQYFGYGVNSYYHVLNFGSFFPGNAEWVVYPTEDSINVPLWWDNYESPNPLRMHQGAAKRVGYPIVVTVQGDGVKNVKLKSAKLWIDSTGLEVPIYVNSPEETGGNDNELRNEVILIPKDPLKANTTYLVSVVLEVIIAEKSVTFDQQWFFTTEQAAGQGKDLLHQLVAYPELQADAALIQFRIAQDYIWVDKQAYPLDVAPFIENGRTMVPFRALGNSLGAVVDWNESSKTISYKKDDTTIVMPIGSNVVTVNGREISLDQGAIIRNGRSFVPTRFISEQLGADVQWFGESQEAWVNLK